MATDTFEKTSSPGVPAVIKLHFEKIRLWPITSAKRSAQIAMLNQLNLGTGRIETLRAAADLSGKKKL
jgi:hypothetical protein